MNAPEIILQHKKKNTNFHPFLILFPTHDQKQALIIKNLCIYDKIVRELLVE